MLLSGEFEMKAERQVDRRRAAARFLTISFCLAACGWSEIASSQTAFDPTAGKGDVFDRNKYVSVTQRPQPEFDPKPIKIGEAELLAEAHAELAYDSNVLAIEDDKRDDASGTLGFTADLLARPGGNLVTAFARADVTRFADLKGENAERLGAGAAGVFEAGRDSTVQLGADYAYQPLSRQSELSPISTRPQINFSQYHAFAGATYGPGRIHVSGYVDYIGKRFAATAALDPAAPRLDFADRNFFSFTGRGDYAVSGSIAVFGQARGTLYRYSSGTPTRNSNRIELLAGLNFELSMPVRGEISLGYISHRYDSRTFRDFKDLGFHGKVEFLPTSLLTLGVTVDRDFGDTSLIGVAGVRLDNVRARADYELLRNFRIKAEGGVSFQNYRGIDLSYTLFSASVSGEYAVSPALAGNIYYRFQDRDAEGTIIGREFDAGQVGAGVSYRF